MMEKKNKFFSKLRTLEYTGSDLCALAVGGGVSPPLKESNPLCSYVGEEKLLTAFSFLPCPLYQRPQRRTFRAHTGSRERYLVPPGERMNSLDSQSCAAVKETLR